MSFDNAACIQVRHEVIATAESRGYTLLWDKTKVWMLPGSHDIWVVYHVWDGRVGRMKIPYDQLWQRGEIMDVHFPHLWDDPVC